MEAERAIVVLLECGVSVEKNRWHLYRTASGQYRLLNFNDNADLVRDREECFDDVHDAVSKFLRRTQA